MPSLRTRSLDSTASVDSALGVWGCHRWLARLLLLESCRVHTTQHTRISESPAGKHAVMQVAMQIPKMRLLNSLGAPDFRSARRHYDNRPRCSQASHEDSVAVLAPSTNQTKRTTSNLQPNSSFFSHRRSRNGSMGTLWLSWLLGPARGGWPITRERPLS